MLLGQVLRASHKVVKRFKRMSSKEMKEAKAINPKEVVSVLPVMPFQDIALGNFDEIIDCRTPLEFQEDHVLGSINLPVLSNEERAEVGTLYCSDKLKGRKVGAAKIARNISDHILDHFKDKDLEYRPLVYCWRGGQRSRSMATILKEIGFQPTLLQAGYKAYRQNITKFLCNGYDESPDDIIRDLNFIRISGVTGSGKTLLLQALQARGEQILDLEDLAKHKGSILGDYPDEPQPSQKFFETKLFNEIHKLNTGSVIWLENEGSKIGNIGVSRRVWEKMCRSPRVHIKVDLDDRIDYVLKDYKYLIENDKLPDLLKRLEKYAGNKTYTAWIKLNDEGKYRELVKDLIKYYDSSYKTPTGPALREFNIPPGYLLNESEYTASALLTEFIQTGRDYHAEQEKLKQATMEHVKDPLNGDCTTDDPADPDPTAGDPVLQHDPNPVASSA